MIHTSLLLKPVTALAVVFFAVATWAADTSEEQEGTKLYCVKRIDAEDGEYLLQLSQHYGNYTPGSGNSALKCGIPLLVRLRFIRLWLNT